MQCKMWGNYLSHTHKIFLFCSYSRNETCMLFYLGAKLSLDPVEVVVQIAPFHQIPAPGRQLGNDPGSLREKVKI